MRVIIAGTRTITDKDVVFDFIEECRTEEFVISEVVCGRANGVDALGARWAEYRWKPIAFFPADWERSGKSAGPKRNKQMAEYADALILIWDGKSRGSANMLKEAKKRKLVIRELIVP